MNKPTNRNPGGGEILPCANDAACEITSCQICMMEVPISATLSEEGADYLHHFCGLDCLEIWRRRAREEVPAGTASRAPHPESGEGV